MGIFGILENDSKVQVGDKTRLGADKSFVTKGNAPILKVLIRPEGVDDDDYIDVSGASSRDWYLDWVYGGSTRAVTVTLKCITTLAVEADPDHVPPIVAVDEVSETFTKTVNVMTASDDMLFSADTDLTALEPDILKWVPDGRSSWLNVHRAVQEKIIDWLNKAGVVGINKLALTKAAIVDVNEVRFWSRDWTLALIYKGIQNASDDVFSEKAKFYFKEAEKGSERALLRLDLNADGEITANDSINMMTRDLVRR